MLLQGSATERLATKLIGIKPINLTAAHGLMDSSLLGTISAVVIISSYNLETETIIGPYCPAPLEQVKLSPYVPGKDLSASIIVHPAQKTPLNLDLLDNV